MKRIRIICCILLIALFINSVPATVYADDNEDEPICGDILSSDEFISSVELFDFTEYDEDGNPISGAIVIPDSVDHSTSPYFPAIVSQGQLPACTSYATTHYQFTYEANRARGIVTTPDNTYCPNFTFSLANSGFDGGSTLQRNYEVLSNLGCFKYSDYDEYDLDSIFSCSVVDSHGDLVRTVASSVELNQGVFKSVNLQIDIPLGDLDYDGVLTDNDSSTLKYIIANYSNISSLKFKLADMDGNNVINARDSLILKGLI